MKQGTSRSEMLEAFLGGCTAADVLCGAMQMIDHCESELAEPECADGLRRLALRLMELLPVGSERIEQDLNALVDLLTARKLCGDTAPALSAEYEAYLHQARQLRQQEKQLQEYEAQLARAADPQRLQQLEERNAKQEDTIRRLQNELKEEKEKAQCSDAKSELEELKKALEIKSRQYTEKLGEASVLRLENARIRRQQKQQLEELDGLRRDNAQLKQKCSENSSEELAMWKERAAKQEKTIYMYQTTRRIPFWVQKGTYLLDLKTNIVTGPDMPAAGFKLTDRGAMDHIKALVVYNGADFCLPDLFFYNELTTVALCAEVRRLSAELLIKQKLGKLSLFFEDKDCRIDIPPEAMVNVRIWAKPGGNIQKFALQNRIAFTPLTSRP